MLFKKGCGMWLQKGPLRVPWPQGFYNEKRALLSDEEFDQLKEMLYQTLGRDLLVP